jgi:photosystem II S4 domain protein
MLASARPARSIATVLSPASAARALVTRAAAALPGSDASASGRSSPAVVTSSRCASRAVSRRGLRGERVISRAGKKGSKGGGAASGLLSGVHPDSVEAVARIVEKAQAASDQWRVETTAFLDPALAADALMCLERAADVAAFPWGGHARAERVRIITGRPETLGEPWEEGGGDEALGDEALGDAAAASASSKGAAPPADSFRALASDTDGAVVFLDVRGNFVFDAADHRDFLGAVLGTGIERDRIGDIYVNGERGAAVLCAPEMASFLQSSLGSVRSVPVTCVVEPLSSLRLPPARRDAFSSIEASMRLDAVASAGFRMSRSKMSALIAAGAVRVNWREGCKPKTVVAAGDVISLRGKGRVEVGDVSETKKGKFQVELVRYL